MRDGGIEGEEVYFAKIAECENFGGAHYWLVLKRLGTEGQVYCTSGLDWPPTDVLSGHARRVREQSGLCEIKDELQQSNHEACS
jgi:hypothetical protein